jgi:hypothetical protein
MNMRVQIVRGLEQRRRNGCICAGRRIVDVVDRGAQSVGVISQRLTYGCASTSERNHFNVTVAECGAARASRYPINK